MFDDFDIKKKEKGSLRFDADPRGAYAPRVNMLTCKNHQIACEIKSLLKAVNKRNSESTYCTVISTVCYDSVLWHVSIVFLFRS